MMAHRLRHVAGGLALLFLLAAVSHAREDKDKEKDKLDLDKIPKKVMDALKAKFPKAKIHKWTKEKEAGAVVYDIEFKQGDQKFEADIKEDGTIVNYEEEVQAKDLPAAVKKTVDKKYPKAKLKEIMKITDIKDKKEVRGGYEIVLETADKKEVEITVADDGKVLEDSGEEKKKDKKDKD